MLLLSSAEFFQNLLYQKTENLSDTLSVSNDSDSDRGQLIWVQTVCKGYQQTTKVVASREGVNGVFLFKPSSKYFFTDRPKAVLLFLILFVSLSCCLVCSLQPCGHLLGKGSLGSFVCVF